MDDSNFRLKGHHTTLTFLQFDPVRYFQVNMGYIVRLHVLVCLDQQCLSTRIVELSYLVVIKVVAQHFLLVMGKSHLSSYLLQVIPKNTA